jgi:NAD(P)-dependent dehydrogenase (short-subunit alcohol dehydrogenase family)
MPSAQPSVKVFGADGSELENKVLGSVAVSNPVIPVLLMALFHSMSVAHALVVGASGGIGLAFIHRLLADSDITHVYATYRSPERAAALLALQAQHSERLHCIAMDIAQEEQIISGLAQIKQSSPALQLVINCVGLLHSSDQQPEKALRQLNAEHLMSYFKSNSIGPVLLAKHLLPLFDTKQPALFATLSAKVGSIGDNQLGGWYGYRASKAALNMFLKTAALEYSRRSPQTILVMLHPGTTDTELSKPFQRGVPPEKLFSPERTVTQLLKVLSKRTLQDSGEFFSWDGSQLPW